MAGSCTEVKNEMLARVDGQYDAWHDPHNNGTYSVISNGDYLELSRTTANLQYTDKMDFTFTDGDNTCTIEGCSESQVTSVADFSTNYCNLRMLYCSSADGCSPVTYDLTADETSVDPSFGASATASDCMAMLGGRLRGTQVNAIN